MHWGAGGGGWLPRRELNAGPQGVWREGWGVWATPTRRMSLEVTARSNNGGVMGAPLTPPPPPPEERCKKRFTAPFFAGVSRLAGGTRRVLGCAGFCHHEKTCGLSDISAIGTTFGRNSVGTAPRSDQRRRHSARQRQERCHLAPWCAATTASDHAVSLLLVNSKARRGIFALVLLLLLWLWLCLSRVATRHRPFPIPVMALVVQDLGNLHFCIALAL